MIYVIENKEKCIDFVQEANKSLLKLDWKILSKKLLDIIEK